MEFLILHTAMYSMPYIINVTIYCICSLLNAYIFNTVHTHGTHISEVIECVHDTSAANTVYIYISYMWSPYSMQPCLSVLAAVMALKRFFNNPHGSLKWFIYYADKQIICFSLKTCQKGIVRH